jgi:CO dehydrogenase maturation factor
LTFTIAVSGKGGTGKTTLAALLVRILWEKAGKPVLAVDADPNANLNEALGVPVKAAVGEIRERLLDEKDNLSPSQTKEDYLNYMIQSSLTEYEGFDLLVMGRPEGPGCYCYVNNLLRKIIDSITSGYPLVVIDAEAGLEHFSRRTTRDVDALLITTDPTDRGIATAKRIAELVKEIDTKVGRQYVIANRVAEDLRDKVVQKISVTGLECIGMIPEDPLVQEFDINGKPLVKLPKTSKAYQAALEIVDRLSVPEPVFPRTAE